MRARAEGRAAAPQARRGAGRPASELAAGAGAKPRGPRVVVIDNYDSFTFNLVQYLGELGAEVLVHRNDAIGVAALRSLRPQGVVLSPGPCTPSEAGVTLEVLRALSGELPILGVCLGHQAIGQAFGGRVVRNARIVHGKASPVRHRGEGLYQGLPSPFQAGRYHSLVVERASLPRALRVTAWTDQGEIMGLRHRALEVEGVQFHPESILTEGGKQLLGTWLSRLATPVARPGRGETASIARAAPAPRRARGQGPRP